MPSSTTPGSSNIHKFQSRDVDIGLRRLLNGSALPRFPQIRFTWDTHFGASVVGTLLQPVSLLAPLNGSDRIAPAIGGFYIRASGRSVALPASGYDYNSDWTPLLTGLSPAGMAASLAAPATCVHRIWSYSITSSARASRVGGIVSPSALAVFRLMTSSNLVGCSTGRSAGFAPRRILSTCSAARRHKCGKFAP